MATATFPLSEQRVELDNISWQTYERLLEELRDRRLQRVRNEDYLDVVRSFRQWVREQI